jgi:hypothetical protein
MRIKAINCEECGDIVYSRTADDLRECTCGSTSAAGGQSHSKFYTIHGAKSKKITINLDISNSMLYDDWREMLDAYGLIKESKPQKLAHQ